MSGASTMGKERKRAKRTHCSGYPYFPIHSPIQHAPSPYTLSDEDAQLLLGLFCDPSHPLYATSAEATKRSPDLKRLEFLRQYSAYYLTKTYNLASSVYNTGRAFTPPGLDSSIKAVEDKVSEFGTPLLCAVQDRGEDLLRNLDLKVDNVLVAAHDFFWAPQAFVSEIVEKQRESHEAKINECNGARHAYLSKVEETVEFLKDKGISGTARFAASTVLGRVEEAQQIPPSLEQEAQVLVTKVGEAWTKFATLPPVAKLVETAQPSVEFARRKYLEAHDAIIASQTYSKALEAAAIVLAKVQESIVYKAAATKLYPVISPYADPALDKITHSPYYGAIVDHLKPCAPIGAGADVPRLTMCAQC